MSRFWVRAGGCFVLLATACAGPERVERVGRGTAGEALSVARPAPVAGGVVLQGGPYDPPPGLVDMGGPTLNDVRVVDVSWGAQIDPGLRAMLPHFYADLVSSNYLSRLAEYGIQGGSYGGSFVIGPKNGSTTLSPDDIGAELAAQVSAGHLPGDGGGGVPGTLYVVHFSPRIQLAYPKGPICDPSVGGAYHDYRSGVAFAAIPDQASCAYTASYVAEMGVYNLATWVITHEIEEAVTDPELNAWYDTSDPPQEIGDKCNSTEMLPGASGVQWFVCQRWSNVLGGCVAGNTTPVPPASPGGSATARGSNIDLVTTDPTGKLFADDWGPVSEWQPTTLSTALSGWPYTPTAVSARSPANLDTFFFDAAGALQTAAWNAGTWFSGPMSWAPPSVPFGNVAALGRSPVNVDVFYVARDGSVQSGYWDGVGWTPSLVQPPGVMPSTLGGPPLAVAAPMPNFLDVFWLTGQGVAWSRGFGYGGSWSPAYTLTPSATLNDLPSLPVGNYGGGLAAVADSSTQEEVFFAEDSGRLGVLVGFGVDWTFAEVPASTFTVPRGAPIAVATVAGGTHAFTIGQDGNVWDVSSAPNVKAQRVTTKGNISPGGWIAAAGSLAVGINVFFYDVDGNLVQARTVNGSWTPVTIPQATPVAPTGCSATQVVCEGGIDYTCQPSPYSLVLQVGEGNPETWTTIGSYGTASWASTNTAGDFRVCATTTGAIACTPVDVAIDNVTGCAAGGNGGGSSSGGSGGGGKPCGGKTCAQ